MATTPSSNKKTESSGSKSRAGSGKTTAGAKTGSRASSAKKTTKPESKEPLKDPIRYRGLKAFLLLALAVFSLIGCFTSEGLFIWFFRRFMQGLTGKGFFFLPAILAYCAVMLIYVRDRPLGGRIVCSLLLTVVFGALIHLFGCKTEFVWDWKLPGNLYDAGVLPGGEGSGGVLGGLLALAFQTLFNKTGAGIILILGTVFLLFTAVDVTVSALVERSRERTAQRAEEWKLMREEEQRRAEERRRSAEENLQARARQEAAAVRPAEPSYPTHPVVSRPAVSGKRRAVIDIPLDEPDTAGTGKEKAGKAPASVKTAPAKTEGTGSGTAATARTASGDKDWLADILTKDRLRTPPSADEKIVHTAIRPKSGAAEPPAPVKTESNPELFQKPAAVVSAKAEPEPAPKISEPESPAERTAGEPAANQGPNKEEIAAVLADEKAKKAAEQAETVLVKAEMVATIEESLRDEKQETPPQYTFPPLTLLTPGTQIDATAGREEMAVNANRLSSTIKSFGIPAEICNVTRGPTVTRYEVELEQGVKLNRLTNLADDIALALGVSGVRIAPVPDKISIVGIEVPNKSTTTVYLRDILDTDAFQNKAGALPFAVGKDIGGAPIIGDISKLPHLMIAGTTGSGKSVCMNSLILSLLYKCSPEDVRLIMVDPKMIELGIYNGIPHLLIPVVTDPKKAAGALQWAVLEMTKRNRMIADSGARDIASYNKLMEKEGGAHLPRMVILIDELADLMMTAAKDVEDSICRIAAVGRACGIHLVVATQRPSADVITGLMKANISSRIAFAVDSALNSRIILDTSGAEKLVGKGDMLYSPIGAGKPTRVQGTFVTDEEREDVINFVKQQGLANYSKDVQEEIERGMEKKEPESAQDSGSDSEDSGELDELFDDAVEVVLDSKQASVSMLQRRLKLGYSRAARIVDQMEEEGVVGPFEGSKPRAVLITREQWEARKNGGAPAPEMPPEAEETDASEFDS